MSSRRNSRVAVLHQAVVPISTDIGRQAGFPSVESGCLQPPAGYLWCRWLWPDSQGVWLVRTGTGCL